MVDPTMMTVGGQGVQILNPAVPLPAQDPFGYQSAFPFPTAPGLQAAISGQSSFGLPDPSTGNRGGGSALYARVPGQAPVTDFYQGIVGNWANDSIGYAPRIPTRPDVASSGRMGE